MKKALLVGINSYKDAPLKGCVNDVLSAQELLQYKQYSTTVLLDADATKANIVQEFEQLLYDSRIGDELVFHFSGHGSQVPDVHGDEDDGLDECLLPVDYTWDNVLLDDEINNLLVTYKGAHIEIVLDACHSGSGTRSVLFNSQPKHFTQRFIQPPMELFHHIKDHTIAKIKPIKLHNVVTWSGCKDDQTSADSVFDKPRGVFSHAFYNSLLSYNGNRICTLHSVRQFIKSHAFSQEPQLTCDYRQRGTAPLSIERSLLHSIVSGYKCS